MSSDSYEVSSLTSFNKQQPEIVASSETAKEVCSIDYVLGVRTEHEIIGQDRAKR